jgi:SAM-dependent methyltransferase
VKAVIKRIKNAVQGKKISFYQEKRENLQNWQMIESHLAADCRNLLDIACDIGYYTRNAATKGIFSIGVDINEPAIGKARTLVDPSIQDRVAFSRLSLDPQNTRLLPQFDVILCLSVYHHFCRMYGEAAGRQMVLDLVGKFSKQMFFQIPSKLGKFRGDLSVDLGNSQEAVEQYVAGLFQLASDCTVRLIGKKKEKPPTEEFRYLFLVEKKS